MKRCEKPLAILLAIVVPGFLSLSGCESIPKMTRSDDAKIVKISSEPAGATVIIAGKNAGETPLSLPYDTFPEKRVGLAPRKTGILVIQKNDCQPYKIHLNEKVLTDDIHAVLACGKAAQDSVVSPAAVVEDKTPAISQPATEKMSAPVAAPESESAEFRLKRLNELHKKGLISDEEYQTIRKEIIEGL